LDAVETNTTPLVSFTYAVDGVATDPVPDSATVTITRADGTVLHTNAATTNAGTGVFTYSLSVSDTSLLDVLTLEWHIGTQTFTTKVQVQGGFYFTISRGQGAAVSSRASPPPTSPPGARSPRKPSSTRHGLRLRPALRSARRLRAIQGTLSCGLPKSPAASNPRW
jgi:hypothetical protein